MAEKVGEMGEMVGVVKGVGYTGWAHHGRQKTCNPD